MAGEEIARKVRDHTEGLNRCLSHATEVHEAAVV